MKTGPDLVWVIFGAYFMLLIFLASKLQLWMESHLAAITS